MEGELLLALQGKLKEKSTREIAIDLFGEECIESGWHDGCAERSTTRRRVRESLHLMNGGYLELAAGKAWPRRRARPAAGAGRSRGSRGRSGPVKRRNVNSTLPAEGPGWFSDPATDAGRGGMSTNRRYLNTQQAADYLGISPKTLTKMRISGDGPRYSKARRRVIYDVADLDAWVEARKRRFTAEAVSG